MSVETSSPVPVETPKTANYFDLAYWQFVNLASGTPPAATTAPVAPELLVYYNAWSLEDAPTPEDPTAKKTTLVKGGGPVRYAGDRLTAILADMHAQALARVTAGAAPDQAEILGQRDAIQTALIADGFYPSGGATTSGL